MKILYLLTRDPGYDDEVTILGPQKLRAIGFWDTQELAMAAAALRERQDTRDDIIADWKRDNVAAEQHSWHIEDGLASRTWRVIKVEFPDG